MKGVNAVLNDFFFCLVSSSLFSLSFLSCASLYFWSSMVDVLAGKSSLELYVPFHLGDFRD